MSESDIERLYCKVQKDELDKLDEKGYLTRGIIKGDYEGYSAAFNSEYQKAIPQSVWGKSLRFSGQ